MEKRFVAIAVVKHSPNVEIHAPLSKIEARRVEKYALIEDLYALFGKKGDNF